MKLLVDENLPPRITDLLIDIRHDAVHVRDLDAPGASEPEIIALALADARTIISADTDFGALLAASGATDPSVILVREVVDRRPPDRVEFLVSCLEQLEAQLQAEAMVTVTRPGSEYADCRCGRQRRQPPQPVGGLLREVDTGAASLLRFRDPLDLSRFGESPVLPPRAPPAMATSATTAQR